MPSPIDDTLQTLGVDADEGLSPDAIEKRRESFGRNQLSQGAQRTTLQRFISQFDNLFIYLLLVAGVITALLGEWLDSGVIFAVVLIIAIIGFIQEGRAEQALESVRDIPLQRRLRPAAGAGSARSTRSSSSPAISSISKQVTGCPPICG